MVPIKAGELNELLNGTRKYLIVVCRDMQTQKSFERFRANFLDYTLLSNKVCLFHITSYSRIHIAHKVEQTYSYFYNKLPIGFKEVSKFIAFTFFKQIRVDRKWPGGKRSKLPPQAKN